MALCLYYHLDLRIDALFIYVSKDHNVLIHVFLGRGNLTDIIGSASFKIQDGLLKD